MVVFFLRLVLFSINCERRRGRNETRRGPAKNTAIRAITMYQLIASSYRIAAHTTHPRICNLSKILRRPRLADRQTPKRIERLRFMLTILRAPITRAAPTRAARARLALSRSLALQRRFDPQKLFSEEWVWLGICGAQSVFEFAHAGGEFVDLFVEFLGCC